MDESEHNLDGSTDVSGRDGLEPPPGDVGHLPDAGMANGEPRAEQGATVARVQFCSDRQQIVHIVCEQREVPDEVRGVPDQLRGGAVDEW